MAGTYPRNDDDNAYLPDPDEIEAVKLELRRQKGHQSVSEEEYRLQNLTVKKPQTKK